MMRGVLVLLLGPTMLQAADWPQILGPKRDGHSSETGLLDSFPKKGPKVVWSHDVGEGFSSPVVAGDQLFVFHRVGNKDTLDCLDPATGKARWTFAYETDYADRLNKGDGPRATPVVGEKHVYVLAADGRLHCVERATGKKVWFRLLHEAYQVPASFFGVGTSPILDGDNIIVNVGGKKAGIVALNRETGKEAWKVLDDGPSYASPVSATLAGRKQLVFFTRTGLAILDPADGKVSQQKRWRAKYDASVNAATPTVVGDEVFLSAEYEVGGTVLRVGKEGLESLWENDKSLSLHFSTAVHHDGHLYGFHGRQERGTEFRCVEWKTGKVKWTKEGFGCGSLIVVDGRLIVLSESGELVLVDPSPTAYREKARAEVLSGPVRAHMALSNGRLFARDGKKLVCFDFKR